MLVSSTLYSQQTAVTGNGQTVILDEDGTWQLESPTNTKLESPHTFVALTKQALERSEPEKALSYAEQALTLAEETYGKALFFYGLSAWNHENLDLAISAFGRCSELKRTRYSQHCLKHVEKLGRTGAYDAPLWATDPLREIDPEPD
jgi:hypothetical protein